MYHGVFIVDVFLFLLGGVFSEWVNAQFLWGLYFSPWGANVLSGSRSVFFVHKGGGFFIIIVGGRICVLVIG